MPSPPWITLVSGLPRSGTSMMMQALEAGGLPALTDRVRTPDVDNPRGYYELDAVKQTKQDPTWLAGAAGKCVKLVHLLLYDLPQGYDYRVILMKRNIAEVMASQEAMLRRLGQPGGDSDDLPTIFQKQLRQVEAWLARQPNFKVCVIDYNRLLRDPGPPLAQVNAFLGGGLDVEAMARAIDPTLYRHRR